MPASSIQINAQWRVCSDGPPTDPTMWRSLSLLLSWPGIHRGRRERPYPWRAAPNRGLGPAELVAAGRARLAGEPSPAGERTARVLAGYRRTAADRGRGQARPFGASALAAVLATGRGVESAVSDS